jgi:hypothetical protein
MPCSFQACSKTLCLSARPLRSSRTSCQPFSAAESQSSKPMHATPARSMWQRAQMDDGAIWLPIRKRMFRCHRPRKSRKGVTSNSTGIASAIGGAYFFARIPPEQYTGLLLAARTPVEILDGFARIFRGLLAPAVRLLFDSIVVLCENEKCPRIYAKLYFAA